MIHQYNELIGLKVLGLVLTLGIFEVPAAAQTSAVGVSAVRAQRFGNESLLGLTPQAGDGQRMVLATGDFNGDGADDLASGMPEDDGLAISPVVDSGTVVVRYGIPGEGLSVLLGSVLRQTPGLNPAELGDLFGFALAACDFNGDGFDDLAVGVASEDYGGHEDAGIVQVHYGTSAGLPAAGDAFYAQSTPGVPGDVEEYDHFGRSLACGDFDHDFFDDLVVGVPREELETHLPLFLDFNVGEGMIEIIPGSPFGLDPSSATSLDRNVAGMLGEAEPWDNFGWSLAAGDFNGDQFDDLAIGVPSQLDHDQEGRLQVVFGGPFGLTPTGNLLWGEDFLGGEAEEDDRFADSLTAGDFDGDGRDDLAIGIALDNDAASNSGQAVVLYGATGGFDRTRTQFWSEAAIYGSGLSEEGDRFGFALAAGDFDRDGTDDLAVSHPYEYLAGPNDGITTILMGSPTGLSSMRRRGIAAGFDGFPGDLYQHSKLFGYALASGDFDGDGHADLAIGTPEEDEAGILNVGAETVLYGAVFADGFETGDTGMWSQAQSSVIGNRLRITGAARLGPAASKVGLAVSLFPGTIRFPATPTYVRVGTDRGFHDERVLKGSFFIDPQNLTVSSNPQLNVFQMIAFTDGVKISSAGANARLAFDLTFNTTIGGWAILANHFDENLGALRFAGFGLITAANDPNGHNTRIDYEWTAGSPGHLTMWRTRFIGGKPEEPGRTLLFSVDLPGMQNAVINNVFAGWITGRDPIVSGALFLDEFTFRR